MTLEQTRPAHPPGSERGGCDDGAPFAALFGAESAAVLRYARTRVDADTAQDVVAETFAVAWRRWDQVPADRPRPWLLAVARRVMANHHRERRHHPSVSLDALTAAGGLDPEAHRAGTGPDIATAASRRRDLFAALNQLSLPDREVLLLATWFDLNPVGLAEVLGCTRSAGTVRVHRARRRLRALLPDPEETR